MNLKEVGSRIKLVRENLMLKRSEFGDKLNITADQVRKIEIADRKPSQNVYIGLNREFGVSLDFIIAGSEPQLNLASCFRTPNQSTSPDTVDLDQVQFLTPVLKRTRT